MNEKSLLTRLGETLDQYRADQHERRSRDTQPQRLVGLARLVRWLMPNGGTLILIALFILTQSVWARPLPSASNAPGPSATTVNYQGRLADPAGNPKTGTYGMTFALYAAQTGGSPVWGPESHTAVPVSNGLFSVGLGSQTSGGIPTSVWNGDRYLEITVGGETLAPRELIRSVPIAGMALTVPDGAVTSAMVQDGSLSPADSTAFADEMEDMAMRHTTSSSLENFGSTVLNFNLSYRAKVQVYLLGSVRNPNGRSTVTLNIDGQDYWGLLYVETNRTEWAQIGSSRVLTMEPGQHSIRPRFGSLEGTDAWAATVRYGYIVLGRAP